MQALGGRAAAPTRHAPPQPLARTRLRAPPPAAAAGWAPPPEAQAAKADLMSRITTTFRGASATKQQRGAIEEAQLALEATAPADLDFDGQLGGARGACFGGR